MMKKLFFYLWAVTILTGLPQAIMATSLLPQVSTDRKISTLLRQLSSVIDKNQSTEIQTILSEWESYLLDMTKYSNTEYQNVMKAISANYHNAVIQLGECSANYKAEQGTPAPEWIDSLIAKFGKAYILKNKAAVKRCLFALNAKNTAESCRNTEKEAIYIEAQRNEAFQRYFQTFFQYIASLEKKEQKLIADRQKAVHEVLQLMEKSPLKNLFADSYLTEMLHLETAKKVSDTELYTHMINDNTLSKPFDVLPAVYELERKIK